MGVSRPCVRLAKPSRRIIVKLMSTALTGFFYTTKRLRTSDKLSMVKFDPRGASFACFDDSPRDLI